MSWPRRATHRSRPHCLGADGSQVRNRSGGCSPRIRHKSMDGPGGPRCLRCRHSHMSDHWRSQRRRWRWGRWSAAERNRRGAARRGRACRDMCPPHRRRGRAAAQRPAAEERPGGPPPHAGRTSTLAAQGPRRQRTGEGAMADTSAVEAARGEDTVRFDMIARQTIEAQPN